MNKSNTQKTANKSGYEIRLEVLQTAMGLADGKYHHQNEALRYEAEKTGKPSVPVAPDNRVEEALAIAEKLYKFVEGK
jgi:Flp pilus assembly CpaE family ATPase